MTVKIYRCDACGQRSNSKRKPKMHRRTAYLSRFVDDGYPFVTTEHFTKVVECGPFSEHLVDE